MLPGRAVRVVRAGTATEKSGGTRNSLALGHTLPDVLVDHELGNRHSDAKSEECGVLLDYSCAEWCPSPLCWVLQLLIEWDWPKLLHECSRSLPVNLMCTAHKSGNPCWLYWRTLDGAGIIRCIFEVLGGEQKVKLN